MILKAGPTALVFYTSVRKLAVLACTADGVMDASGPAEQYAAYALLLRDSHPFGCHLKYLKHIFNSAASLLKVVKIIMPSYAPLPS